jgi:dienelactone hydrolase
VIERSLLLLRAMLFLHRAAAALLAQLFAAALAAPPTMGPWPVINKSFKVPALDSTDPSLWLVYPVCNISTGCPKFPLIAYNHGAAGGDIDLIGYANHFQQIASYGFVVAAPDSCDVGCTDKKQGAPYTDCAGLPPLQPDLWAPWYGEQLKTIEWARNQTANATADPVFATIDWDAGVGIAGHSMGGQATSMSASRACAEKWDIRAAALIHPEIGSLPWGNTGSNISVPVAAFTSSGDNLCPPSTVEQTMRAFNATAQARTLPNVYRNVVGWSHLEPVLGAVFENPLLATYTAAFFKTILNNDRGAFRDLVFGGGPDDLCQSEKMVNCYVVNAPQ